MFLLNESKKSVVVRKMILVNTDYINGKEFEMLGIVKGSTIHSKNIGRGHHAELQNACGGS